MRYAADPANGHEPYRDSVDFFHRYPEDVKLAAGLGLDTFRFSVEWARVMPRPHQLDPAALEHYDRLFDAIAAEGVEALRELVRSRGVGESYLPRK